MKENVSQKVEELKKVLVSIEEMVIVIDKIGTGFDETERAAFALLLFFKQRDVLGGLAKVRKYLYKELEDNISPEEFDNWIENDIALWRPPYDKKGEEILSLIENGDL
ncbi:hypothetical protein [Mixta gaviniae]|uniref:Uncharacterized protein n=1 Tax=Mixta gaviniae TaxID=665914 RepID=A0A2L0ILD1_9GAMM|nr:hypothetical protein [Mixta gaviniae]AUX95366.1 hypothetical protein C2E15_03815 [Mixta gaviniae]